MTAARRQFLIDPEELSFDARALQSHLSPLPEYR
jgi:hypothetical protein